MHNSTQVFYTNAHFGTLFFAKIMEKILFLEGCVLNFPELPISSNKHGVKRDIGISVGSG